VVDDARRGCQCTVCGRLRDDTTHRRDTEVLPEHTMLLPDVSCPDAESAAGVKVVARYCAHRPLQLPQYPVSGHARSALSDVSAP
jgi:hypothetical protein